MGNRAVFLCPFGGDWVRVNLPQGFEPTSMNNNQDIVGVKREDGLSRPWILRRDSEWQWLPYVADHHTTPSYIADAGTIVGSAASDHGSHAITWKGVG